MLLVQGVRQGGAAAHAVADALDQLLRPVAFRKIQQDAERAVQRLTGAEQGRQLVGELGQLVAGERAALEQRRESRAAAIGIGRPRIQRRVALILQPGNHLLDTARLHLPLQGFAGGADGAVAILGHDTTRPSLLPAGEGAPAGADEGTR